MYFLCQHLVFVNFNNFKSCLVLSEVYSKLFILCSHSGCSFVDIFFFLLCKILLLKFWPRKKIQQRTQKVFNWRLYPTSLWRGSACRLSLLEKVAGGWREEGKKSPEHASLGCLAALLTPLHSALVSVIGQERLSWEMPVLSEQMSCCRLLDRAELLALAVLAAWQG